MLPATRVTKTWPMVWSNRISTGTRESAQDSTAANGSCLSAVPWRRMLRSSLNDVSCFATYRCCPASGGPARHRERASSGLRRRARRALARNSPPVAASMARRVWPSGRQPPATAGQGAGTRWQSSSISQRYDHAVRRATLHCVHPGPLDLPGANPSTSVQCHSPNSISILPPESIAQHPARPRDSARLLHIGARADRSPHSRPAGVLRPGDILVGNDTKVIPAQLSARRGDARIGITLDRPEGDGSWIALARNARRLRAGDDVIFDAGLRATVQARAEDGSVRLRFNLDGADFAAALQEAGALALPPYIDRPQGPEPDDARRLSDYVCPA